jgi:hypothetical protein
LPQPKEKRKKKKKKKKGKHKKGFVYIGRQAAFVVVASPWMKFETRKHN